jgi:hypothetical protein
MNLVQINERLKDLPMQVVQQYANGMNPEVPPYLALGELQRRELQQKQMATAQGAMQGPQPSVKEQVEQKAGLMELQQMQQQQMAQQMVRPRGPMPAPAGVPQPEDQPEVAMARGGLAGIPVRGDMFEYAGGGIVAFQSGGQSLNERAARQMREKGSIYDPFFGLPTEERERMRGQAALKAAQDRAQESMAVTESNAQALSNRAQARVAELETNRDSLIRQYGAKQYEQALNKAKGEVNAATARGSELMAQQSQAGQTRVAEATPSPRPPAPAPVEQASLRAMDNKMIAAGLPAAAVEKSVVPTRKIPSGEPRPEAMAAAPAAAPQAGLPAVAQSTNPYEARLNEIALKQPVTPTTQEAISRVSELSPAAMQEAALQRRNQEMRDRAAAYKEQFEKGRPSGLDDLIRVFGQAGQYKGLSGLAPAYTANQQQKRAEELAMARQYNELMNLADTKELEGSKELFGARTKAFDRAQELFGKEKDQVVKATSSLYETTQSRIDNELKRLSDMDIKKLELAQRERERRTNASLNPNAMVLEYAGLMAKSREMREKGSIKEADALAARANDLMTFKSGAGAAAAERNDITAIKNIQAGLTKELSENLRMDAATRARKQQQLDQTYVDLARLGGAGGDGGSGPKIGDVQQGFRFKGGNPADQSNWEKVK